MEKIPFSSLLELRRRITDKLRSEDVVARIFARRVTMLSMQILNPQDNSFVYLADPEKVYLSTDVEPTH